jgi:PhnO protein
MGSFYSIWIFKYGTIDEFFVKKEFRGKGIGSKLIKEAIRKLQRMNVKIILVGTEKENKEAIALYKRVGFEIGKRSLWLYFSDV